MATTGTNLISQPWWFIASDMASCACCREGNNLNGVSGASWHLGKVSSSCFVYYAIRGQVQIQCARVSKSRAAEELARAFDRHDGSMGSQMLRFRTALAGKFVGSLNITPHWATGSLGPPPGKDSW